MCSAEQQQKQRSLLHTAISQKICVCERTLEQHRQQFCQLFNSANLLLTDYGRPMKAFFSLKSRTFGIWQTNWADKCWGTWGIFDQTISTHFGIVSPLSMFYKNQPLCLQKTKPLYLNPKHQFI